MSSVLFRYLAREVIAATLLVLVAFLGLFAFFDVVNELDAIGQDGYEIQHALIYVALLLPGRVYELMPIVVLIGTLYALTALAQHSEITVMRASGMSTSHLLRLLGTVGLLFVATTFIFGEYVAPPAERSAQQWRLMSTGSAVSSELRTGLWVKDGNRVVNVRTLQPDRSMEGVRIFEFDEQRSLKTLSEAQLGLYDSQGKIWRFTDIVQTRFLGDRTELLQVESMDWRSDLSPEVLSVLMVTPERMSVAALFAYIQHLHDNQQNADRFEIALWKKIVYPFAVLVMMALAVPFAMGHARTSAVSVKVFIGVMLGVGFYLLNGLFSNLGVIRGWSPAFSALAPSIMFLAAAAVLLALVERR